MGVCLNYRSRQPVEVAVVDAIRAELPAICAPQPWILCESPGFHERGPDGTLSGFVKLNLMPDPGEWAEAEGFGNEAHDLHALLGALEAWSSRFGIDWDLDIDGSPFGSIAGGRCEPGLRDRADELSDLARDLIEDSGHLDGEDDGPDVLKFSRPPA